MDVTFGMAWGQVGLALKRMSDIAILESRPKARRLAALAEIAAFWAAKGWNSYWIVDIGVVDLDGDDADALHGVVSGTLDDIGAAAKDVLEGRVKIDGQVLELRGEDERVAKGIRGMVGTMKTVVEWACGKGNPPSFGICMTCGTPTTDDECPVCGGGRNQIVMAWGI